MSMASSWRWMEVAAAIAAWSGAWAAAVGWAGDASPLSLDRRVPWTTSKIQGSPEPPAPYRVVTAFPKLKFDEPLDMACAPGTQRLFVVERYGRILSFENDPAVEQAEVFLELKGKVFYGLAFHPNYAENGYVYVTIVVNPKVEEEPRGTRVSRFRVQGGVEGQVDPDSEQVLIEWPSGGHNGGCLQFGPDGCLYIATGDSSGIADEKLTGQDLTSLSGKILRIDVDQPEPGRAYAVPRDNPFVDVPHARPEIWAYGLRQPWKMSFDQSSGDLWAGNVGQDLWEQIFLIERGGNYGWSVMEGNHPFRPERPRGPSPFLPPIVEHDHAEFRSITGGYVYRGKRLPELRGAYIYGDYDTGKIWMLRYDRDSRRVTEQKELVDSSLRLVGFAEDHAGELFLVDHMSGLISRLEKNSQTDTAAEFPRRLSETGLFQSVPDHLPAPGVIPYDVIAPQWADGAVKERFLALPGTTQIEFDGVTYPQPAPGAPHGWRFPDGAVIFETISMELEPGNTRSRKRLETRILHYEQLSGTEQVGDQYWRGYTYIWNDDQSDAVLLEDPQGKDVVLQFVDARAEGGRRSQTWHFPGRAECLVCHNMAAKYALGVNTLQLNRNVLTAEGQMVNQLAAFEQLGLFTAQLPEPPEKLPRLVDYRDESQATAARARSYLHANCSHCHRKWGGGNAEFRLLASLELDEMGIVGVKPAHGGFFIPDAQIIAPGRPDKSVLFYRTAKLGPGRMPRIGSDAVDQAGLKLLYRWILEMGSTVEDAAGKVAEELAAATEESRFQRAEELLATTTGAMQLLRAVESDRLPAAMREALIARAAAHPVPHVRDLFERFLPEEQRTKRLGAVVRPQEILSLAGDAERGRELFFTTAGVQCRNCHKIAGQGTEIGPDLSAIGKKYADRARLLDTILNPSREVDPQYRMYLLQTAQGRVLTGLLARQDEREVVLKDTKGELTAIPAAEVEALVPQQQSMMPELLLRDLTAQQVADLLAFLGGLTP